MIYNIIVAPIVYIVGWIFLFIVNKIPSIGVIGAICGVSLAINILALPLYNIADAIQEKERQINKKLEYRVKRIKKAFKGDEQFMMLSEYYRQNNYHPLYALRGSLSILIEIPFFIAAYNYLSSSEILKESSFWIFSNLGEPDQMFSLTLGSIVIPFNVLPIIMTAINFVSGYIYTKNATTRDKVQLYALGIFFLVLLYNSPSGLVIYWILNNLFSLVKTIVLKTKHPGRFLHAFISLVLIVFAYMFRDASIRSRFYFVAFVAAAFTLAPVFIALYKKSQLMVWVNGIKEKKVQTKSYFSFVLVSGLALAFLCGFLLPSSTIATSPEEFSCLGSISNPTSYVWSTLWFFVGLFVFWPLVVYKMFGDGVKRGEAILLFTILVVALFDAFVFKGEYGKLSNQFYVENVDALENLSTGYKVLPIVVAIVSVLAVLVVDHFGKLGIISLLCLSVAFGEAGIGTVKMVSINRKYKDYVKLMEENQLASETSTESRSVYHLSKTGKNVVVLFLDRAVGPFFPYALEQIPELEDQLSGFVYYPNTVSYGANTTLAAPAMMGGYEYTTEKLNEREGLLKDLHNEASLVAPVLFRDADYTVTVTDPPFPNYSWRGDLSAFSAEEGITATELYSKNANRYYEELNVGNQNEDTSLTTKAEAINFSVLQVLPPFFRFMFEGYCRNVTNYDYRSFAYSFANLYYFDELTDFTGEGNSYIFIGNDSTHNPVALNSSLLYPATDVDSFASALPSKDENTYELYCSFVASLKQIGKWLDYLRDNGCYDNTRIIIVSDHGYSISSDVFTESQSQFLPLLLVKDFNSNEKLTSDYTFMTNADTLFLAKEGLDGISNTNPFTGEELVQEKEDGVNAYSAVSESEWNAPLMVNYTQFTLDKDNGWHIQENIFDDANWTSLSVWEDVK